MDIIPLIIGTGLWLNRLTARHVTAACVITILGAGCASNYQPKPDLTSVETIGVVLPNESSEPMEAGNAIQLYNRTVGEDRLKNSAVGAGTGATVGTAVGIGTFEISRPAQGSKVSTAVFS